MTAYYNEIDPYAAQWLRNLIDAGEIAPGDVDERDIRDVRPNELAGYDQCHFFAGIGVWSYALRLAGWDDDRQVWTGSCPCQPFSSAGRGKGTADERHLWPHWFHLISQCRPATIFGEQVASPAGLGWYDLVSADLEGTGYALGAADICAAGVGAPHIRQRLWIVAQRMGDPIRSRLEGHNGNGDEAPGRTLTTGSAAETGGNGGLADDDGDRCSQRGQHLSAPRDDGFIGDRSIDGLAVSPDDRRDFGSGLRDRGSTERGRQEPANYGSIGHNSGRPRPTDGFWRDADWLFCRDGKWRPVEPIYVEMADGTSRGMGQGSTEERRVNEIVQGMRENAGEETVWSTAGGQQPVPESDLLRPDVYGERVRGNESSEQSSRIPSVSKAGERGVRDLPEDGPTTRSSQGREPPEQYTLELDDIVPFLSSSRSLAELRGDRKTEEALLVLYKAIYEEADVRDTSEPLETVWASLGEEEKRRLRMGFDASRWNVVAPFPLIDGSAFHLGSSSPFEGKSRQGMLRGYGNAINAEVAAAFIGAIA